MSELLHPLGGRRAWAVWFVAASAYAVTVLLRGTLGVAGLTAADRFGITASALASFTVVQLVVYAAMQVPAGILLDRYGSRRMLIASALILVVAQTLFSLAASYPLALLARALHGAGDALVFISVLRVGVLWFPVLRQPMMSQLVGILAGAGAIASQVPLAWALQEFGWTPAFAAMGLFSLLIAVAVAVFVKDTPYDVRPGRTKMPAAQVLSTLKRAWREPGTRLGIWTHFTTSFPPLTFGLLWGFPFLVRGEGLTPGAAAGLLTLLTVLAMLVGPVVGRYAARYPFYRSWIVLAVVGATSATWTVVLLWPGRAPMPVLVLLVAVLAAGGPGSNLGFDYARTFNPATRFGAANGIVNGGGYVATLVGLAAVGVVLDLSSGGVAPGVADFKWAFATQYALWGLGTVQIVRHRRMARAALARNNPEVYEALYANRIIPIT